MEQNKNNSANKILVFVIAIIVLTMSICYPAYAYTDSSLNGIDFEDQPLPVNTYEGTNDEKFSKGYVIAEYVDHDTNNTRRQISIFSTNNDSVYCFAINQNTEYRYYIVSTDPFTWARTIKTTNLTTQAITYAGSSYEAGLNTSTTPNMYRNTTVGILYKADNPIINIPIFNTYEDGINAVNDWILNPPPQLPITGEFTSQLQAGYAMTIDITNLNVSLTLHQTTPISYWGLGATQFIGTVTEIPNPITENSVSSLIRWSGTGKTDMYGKYYNWVSNNTISGNASDHQHVYVLIVNPLNNSSTTGSGYDVETTSNGIITVHASNSNHVKIYPMSTTFNAGNFESTTEGISATGSPDGNGGLTYTDDTTGQTYTQEHGGLTTPTNTQNSINAWLENIANTIGGFFSGAVGAVTTLVNAGSAFINQLINLYSWLPAPVYTVLSSALILVITIGVIKVFV